MEMERLQSVRGVEFRGLTSDHNYKLRHSTLDAHEAEKLPLKLAACSHSSGNPEVGMPKGCFCEPFFDRYGDILFRDLQDLSNLDEVRVAQLVLVGLEAAQVLLFIIPLQYESDPD